MLKDRLKELFATYDPPVQMIISKVLRLEQNYISMERPHIKDLVDHIISEIAAEELGSRGQNTYLEQ